MGLLNRKPGGLTENPRLLNRKPRGLTENPCLLNRSPLGLTANPCLLNRGFADAYTAALQQIKRVNTLITPMAVCWFSYVDGTLKSITWTYPCLSQTGVSPSLYFFEQRFGFVQDRFGFSLFKTASPKLRSTINFLSCSRWLP